MRLIANIIGKDEADRHLEDVLKHLSGIVDEIVYTDDASSDNTVEIFKDFGARVYTNDVSKFSTDEGAIRNDSWANLGKHAEVGDWVLAIDCDEKLWIKDKSVNLDNLMGQKDFDVLNIDFVHMWNDTHYRVDKAWKPHGSTRMFRFFLGGKFKDRKLACGSEPTYVQTLVARHRYMRETGLVMQHLGYVRDEDKRAKYERYMAIDGGDFHAMNHIQSIIDPDPTLEEWTV